MRPFIAARPLGRVALALGVLVALGVDPASPDKPPHLSPEAADAFAMQVPAVRVTGVAANHSSAKVRFAPVPGARDYRAYDVSNPTVVKYAGMRHLDAGVAYHFVTEADGVTPVVPLRRALNTTTVTQPRWLHVPAPEIEWVLLDDHRPHALVVEAVDKLGPVPPGALTDDRNDPLVQPAGMLGSNAGSTPDGKSSTNGQGAPTNNPQAIARSPVFLVQANAAAQAIPSKPTVAQHFFDTFENEEGASLVRRGSTDARAGTMQFGLNAGTPKAWDILYQGADTDHSVPFIKGGHFMDILFEGITPSSLPPGYEYGYHSSYASMAMSPVETADLSQGKLLHLTAEVDSHMSRSHRWLAWQLAPADDPITNFKASDQVPNGFSENVNSTQINRTNKALWAQIFPMLCEATLFSGHKSGDGGAPQTNMFVPIRRTGGLPPCIREMHWGGNGTGLDNRQRWDLFVTTSHIALFEDGQLIMQSAIPGGLPFDRVKVYFTHYVYAMGDDLEKAFLRRQQPWESYWLYLFRYSDERHWDNIGFEVLPASEVPPNNDFSQLAGLITIPGLVPPQLQTPSSAPAAPLPSHEATH